MLIIKLRFGEVLQLCLPQHIGLEKITCRMHSPAGTLITHRVRHSEYINLDYAVTFPEKKRKEYIKNEE